MSVDEARRLRKTDKVLWTWVTVIEPKPTPGTVVATNATSVSIMWADSPGMPSNFSFSDEEIWEKIAPAPDARKYEPLPGHVAIGPSPRRSDR